MTFVFCPGSCSNGYRSFSKLDNGELKLRVRFEDVALRYGSSVRAAVLDGLKAFRLHGLKASDPVQVPKWDMYEVTLTPVE